MKEEREYKNSSLIVAVNKKLPQQRHLLTTPATEILESRFAMNGGFVNVVLVMKLSSLTP